MQPLPEISNGFYTEAITSFQAAIQEGNSLSADLYDYLGKAYQKIGQEGEAINAWRQAADAYRKDSSKQSQYQLASVLVELAQAYLELGQIPQARPLLAEALDLAHQLQDLSLRATAYGTQGNALLLEGQLEKAIEAYQTSLDLADQSNQSQLAAVALAQLTQASTRLASYYQQQSQWSQEAKEPQESQRWLDRATAAQEQAHSYAQKALEASTSLTGSARVCALLNFLSLSQTPQQRAVYRE